MSTRLTPAIGLAGLLLLFLCTALAGQSAAASDYTLATADGLSLILSTDGQITSLQIDGNELVSASAPALWLRDLSDAGTITAPNLVANPGFEESLTGWTQLANSGLTVTVAVSPTHGGSAALQFAAAGDTIPFAAYAGDPVPVTAGRRYRVSAWWRSARGYVTRPTLVPTQWQMGMWHNQPRSNGLYVQWLDAGSRPLGNPQLAVPLHWNANDWRLIRRELTAPADAAFARLIIGAQVEDDTLWVDDVALVPSPEPDLALGGVVVPCPDRNDCLRQTVVTGSLAYTLTYTAHGDHIAVHGEITDTAGRDRALDVTWGVPLDLSPLPPTPSPLSWRERGEGVPPQAAGVRGEVWTWWDDARDSRSITDTRTYANAISAIYDGWLPISLYPYAGIALSPLPPTPSPLSQLWERREGVQGVRGEGLGLALALPLDRPQLALLSYDGASGRYGATFHLGISPRAVKVGPRAGFDLLLYRFNPDWGFRDVIARHRAIQPEAYTTDLPVYSYDGRSQGQYYTSQGAQQVLADDVANTYSAQYTVGEFHVRINPDSEPKPDMTQIMQVVSDTLQHGNERTRANMQALLASATVDTNGDWSVKKLGSFPWSQGMWEMIWAGNVDPDIPDGLGQFMLNGLIDPAFEATQAIGARLDGVQIDNFQSVPTFDLRPEAIAVADIPLSYTPHTYQPAVHTGFAFHEYLAHLRQHLDDTWGTDRGISINFWGLGNPNYLAPFLDVMGSEGNLGGGGQGPNWTPEVLAYRRAIAFSRPYLFANQTTGLTASEAYTFTQMALLYGVGVGPGPNASGWEPLAQQIVSDTQALVTQYWAAGWEPLTYARADSDDVWIERFGALYFAVHNRTDLACTATITIETTPLGLTDPSNAVISDVATSETIPFSVVDGNIVVDLALGPRETRVLQVSPPASQCVSDVNANGVGGVVDIQVTAADLNCLIYLPLVAANWRQPWPTPSTFPYPRLHANLFNRVPEDEAAYDALSRYGAVTTGSIYSNGREGGSTWVSARALARGRIPPTT